MNTLRKHFLGTTAMFRVLTRAMIVAVAIPLLSIAVIYGLGIYLEVVPTNKQIKDMAMAVWLGTLVGVAFVAILRRRG